MKCSAGCILVFSALSGCGDDSSVASESDTETSETSDTSAAAASSSETTAPDGHIMLEGGVQKGPFILGSSITASLLSAGGEPTGEVFSSMTETDLGDFSVEVPSSSPIAIEADGFYYNEVVGDLSAAPLTLRAYVLPSAMAVQEVYVNLVTHLLGGR